MANEARYKVTQEEQIDFYDLGIPITWIDEIPKENWKDIARDILQKCWDAQTQFRAPNDGYAAWREGKLEDIYVEANDGSEIEIAITQRDPGEAEAEALGEYAAFVLDDEDKWQIFTPNNFEA